MAVRLGMTNAELIESLNSTIGNVVTLNEDQTITGTKTFTTQMPIRLEADANQQSVPTINVVRQIGLLKNKTFTKGDGFSSWIQGARSTNGTSSCLNYQRRFLDSDSNEIIAHCGAYITTAGEPVGVCNTPDITHNDTAISTTAWVNTKFQVVSALPASPNANVFYFIPE